MQGGAERWCADLAYALHARGAAVIVVAAYDGPFRELLIARGVSVVLVRGLFFRYDPVWWIRYLRTIRNFAPTTLIGALWIGNSAGRIIGALLRIPTIITLHAHPQHEGALRTLCSRLLALLPGHRVAVSPHIPGADTVIENGIDLSRIPRKKSYTIGKEFMILAVGRLVPVKRFDRVIDLIAAARAEGVALSLTIIGDGPLRDTLTQQIRALGLEKTVRLLGMRDAAPFYAKADCFIQTSDSEGLSLALLEALAAGLPALVTHTDYAHPVITHEKTGLIVPLPNPEAALHSGIKKLFQSETIRKELGLQGQALVQSRFSHEEMVEKYCALIERNQAYRWTQRSQ
jgi:glycosyltransferase involved in cell wall biosynthesis